LGLCHHTLVKVVTKFKDKLLNYESGFYGPFGSHLSQLLEKHIFINGPEIDMDKVFYLENIFLM